MKDQQTARWRDAIAPKGWLCFTPTGKTLLHLSVARSWLCDRAPMSGLTQVNGFLYEVHRS
ncbi:hypothetical protein ACQ4M4_08000 [Leptolyngbya sp. AN02str]|uniref:hypothetical protein n=1 Tax=Leptolyngbya sp. AN02str TaxID=3423363 RepID=UPI003D313CEF